MFYKLYRFESQPTHFQKGNPPKQCSKLIMLQILQIYITMGCITNQANKKLSSNEAKGQNAELSAYINKTILKKINQKMTTIYEAEESAEQSRMAQDYNNLAFNKSIESYEIPYDFKDALSKTSHHPEMNRGLSLSNNSREQHLANLQQQKLDFTASLNVPFSQSNQMAKLQKYPTRQEIQYFKTFPHSRQFMDSNNPTRESETKYYNPETLQMKQNGQHQLQEKSNNKNQRSPTKNSPDIIYDRFGIKKALCCIDDC